MGAILREVRPEMAPRRHVRRRSVPATLPHDVPSYDLALGQIWAKSVEKWQSYCIFSSNRKWRRGATSGLRIGAKPSFLLKVIIRKLPTKFHDNRTKIGEKKAF